MFDFLIDTFYTRDVRSAIRQADAVTRFRHLISSQMNVIYLTTRSPHFLVLIRLLSISMKVGVPVRLRINLPHRYIHSKRLSFFVPCNLINIIKNIPRHDTS